METLIGFAIGYLVGTSQGREGLAKMLESIEAIRTSPEARQAVLTGAAIAGSAAKQVLGGGFGTIVNGIVEQAARKAADIMAVSGAEAA